MDIFIYPICADISKISTTHGYIQTIQSSQKYQSCTNTRKLSTLHRNIQAIPPRTIYPSGTDIHKLFKLHAQIYLSYRSITDISALFNLDLNTQGIQAVQRHTNYPFWLYLGYYFSSDEVYIKIGYSRAVVSQAFFFSQRDCLCRYTCRPAKNLLKHFA